MQKLTKAVINEPTMVYRLGHFFIERASVSKNCP
jgi:hypothetical protein